MINSFQELKEYGDKFAKPSRAVLSIAPYVKPDWLIHLHAENAAVMADEDVMSQSSREMLGEVCATCKSIIKLDVYHSGNRVERRRLVGDPGRHVRRVMCDCQVYFVTTFYVPVKPSYAKSTPFNAETCTTFTGW